MYHNLPRNLYEEGSNGPAIHKANISIGLKTGKDTYQIEEKSRVERNQVVGLWMTKPGTLVRGNQRQLNVPVFNSAYLNILVEQTEQMEKVYLEQIRLANEQGRPYEVSLLGKVNLSESEIIVSDSANIPDNTVVEFQVDFVKIRR